MLPSTHHRFGMFAFFVGLLSLLVFGTQPVFGDNALIRTDEQYSLDASAVVDGDLYLAGDRIFIHGSTTGDVLSLGLSQLALYGPVGGDVLAVGGRVAVDSPVAGDLRVVAGEVVIRGTTSEDVLVGAGSVQFTEESHTAGDVIVYGELVHIQGDVDGSLTVHAEVVQLEGNVARDVTVSAGGSLALLGDATIGGDLTYSAPREALQSMESSVAGETTFTQLEVSQNVFSGMISFIMLVVGALFLLFLFPVFARTVVDRALADNGFVAIKGLAMFVALPLALVVLTMSLVALWPAVAVGALFALWSTTAYMLTPIFVGAILARWLKKEEGVHWAWTVLGAIALMFVGALPLVGILLRLMLFLMVFGIIGVLLYEFVCRNRRTAEHAQSKAVTDNTQDNTSESEEHNEPDSQEPDTATPEGGDERSGTQ